MIQESKSLNHTRKLTLILLIVASDNIVTVLCNHG